MAVVGQRQLRKPILPHCLGLQKIAWRCFLLPSHFARYSNLTACQRHKNCCCSAKNRKKTKFATLAEAAEKFARSKKRFSSEPFCTLFNSKGILTSWNLLLPGQKQSENTSCHVNWGWRKLAQRKQISTKPFSMWHNFYGISITQKCLLFDQNQSNTLFAELDITKSSVKKLKKLKRGSASTPKPVFFEKLFESMKYTSLIDATLSSLG